MRHPPHGLGGGPLSSVIIGQPAALPVHYLLFNLWFGTVPSSERIINVLTRLRLGCGGFFLHAAFSLSPLLLISILQVPSVDCMHGCLRGATPAVMRRMTNARMGFQFAVFSFVPKLKDIDCIERY